MKNKRTLFLVEVAIFASVAFLLDWVCGIFFALPQGGSVSIGIVPVLIMAFRWGLKGGLLCGFLLGLLQIVLGVAYVFHPVQVGIDYLLAFTVVGFAGIWSGKIKEKMKIGVKKAYPTIIFATFVGGILRFICHFSSGYIFFGSYAPEGQPVWLYSLLYNAIYMIPTILVSCFVVLLVISTGSKKLFQ